MTGQPQVPPKGRKRKHRSLRVERDACLIALGIDPTKPWHMQHAPALGCRPFYPELDDYAPAENDPRHMFPMQEAAHKKVTHEVDRPAVDKTRRQAKDQFRHFIAMVGESSPTRQEKRSKWPSRKLQSRGFEKRRAG